MGLWMFLTLVIAGLMAVEGHRAGDILRGIITEPFPLGEGNSRCRKDSETYLQALGRLEGWAINMYDSASKIPSGILTGNTVLLGQYYQCLAVEGPEFKGQYCNVHIDVHLVSNVTVNPGSLKELLMSIDNVKGGHGSRSYRWALCVPSSCDLLDVKRGLLRALDPFNGAASGTVVRILDISCSAVRWQAVQTGDYLFITLASLIILVVMTSTIYDVCVMKNLVNEAERWKRIRCLSLRTSCLMLMENKQFPGKIGCLSGLRFLSVAWIIVAHAAYTVGVTPNMDSLELNSWKFQLNSSQLSNASMATDAFFLVAGFTVTLGFIKHCKLQQGPPKIYSFWLRKIVKILPAYAFVVFFHATSVRLIGDGPMWNRIIGSEARKCRNYWWANLLFISNFFKAEDQCINQSWYIAADVQLYLFVGPFLYVVWKYFNKTHMVAPIIGFPLIASIIVPIAVAASQHLSGAVLSDTAEVARVYQRIYIHAYTKAEPFMFGMGLGYFMSYYQGRALPLNRFVVVFLWFCCSVLLIPAMLLGRHVTTRNPNLYVPEPAFFAAFQCTACSLIIAWVILACSNGIGGPIDYILSLPIFEPLEKVLRCTFLAHFVFLYYAVGIRLTPDAASPFVVLQTVIGLLTTSIAAGSLLFLFVEQPIISLVRSFGRETVNVSEHEMQINLPSEDRLSSNEQTEMSCLGNKQGVGSSEENEESSPIETPEVAGTSGTSGASFTSVSSPTPTSDSRTLVED